MAGQPSQSQSVYIQGLSDLRRLIKPPDELIAAPWKEAMQDLAELGERSGRAGAPRRTGALQNKIRGVVQRKPFPMWVAVRSRGVRKRSKKYPKGYPYPRMLNYSPKHGHQGWFDRAVIYPVTAQAEVTLVQAAGQIAKKWGR